MQIVVCRTPGFMCQRLSIQSLLYPPKPITCSRRLCTVWMSNSFKGRRIVAVENLRWNRSTTILSGSKYAKFQLPRLSSSLAQEKDDVASASFPDTTGFDRNINGIPKPALYIGFAGAVPFIALSIASGIHLPFPLAIAKAQASYAACILTFLGAVHWGKALESEKPEWKTLIYSVSPSVFAWTTFALPTQVSLYFLSAGLLGAYIVDVREQRFPQWYRSLRMPLSLIAISCVLLTAYNTPLFG